jgi:outer membrane protein assembly factor BamB
MIQRRSVLKGAGAALGLSALGLGANVLTRSHHDEPQPLPSLSPGPNSWPTGNFDQQNTSCNPAVRIPPTEPPLRWEQPVPGGSNLVVGGDRVVVGQTTGKATAFDRVTGASDWTVAPPPGHRDSAADTGEVTRPVLAGDGVFIEQPERAVRVERSSGEQQTVFEVPRSDELDFLSEPVLWGGNLYLAGAVISCFDGSGRCIWWTRRVRGGSGTANVAIADDSIVLTRSRREITSYRTRPDPWQSPIDRSREVPTAKTSLWTGGDVESHSGAPVGEERIYLPCATKNDTLCVRALDPQSGATLWQSQPLGDGLLAAALHPDSLLVATGANTVRSLSLESGETKWVRRSDRRLDVEASPWKFIAGRNACLLAPDNGGLHRIGITDTRSWTLAMGAVRDVAVVRDELYVIHKPANGRARLRSYGLTERV